MPLSAGTRLGPYEVVSPLGAGGMGEVYRVVDTRLGRQAAVKVLPRSLLEHRERIARFEREARAASALNHPNIVTIYETGSGDFGFYIAMELVEGRTLREMLHTGPIPLRRLLPVAAQIADGLARAHEAGIVHRDLKPDNLMVTKDGLVKILDFGLAKLSYAEEDRNEDSRLATMTQATEPGVVLGTAGYMSPEQASGHPLDFRSDQFSFGSVLYEMATGKRAFARGTAVQTLAAILQEEPEPVGSVNPKVPSMLRWIVERCLAKDPAERYASTEDLARDLATLRDRLSEAVASGSGPAESAAGRRRGLFAAALGLALAAVAAAALLAGRQLARRPPPRFQQLTFRRGAVSYARFAPDGRTIVYSAWWQGKPLELFTTQPGTPESRSLGLAPADILSIASSGEMAIALRDHPSSGMLARVPLAGGAPREVLENVGEADWTPDGKSLAVTRLVAGKRWIEFPIGKVLYEAAGSLYRARLSPRGDRIAFQEDDQIAVVDLHSVKKDLPRMRQASGFAWSPSGEIWLVNIIGGNSEILAVTPGGRQRLLFSVPGELTLHDVWRDGRVLLERGLPSSEIVGASAGDPRERNLTWLDGTVLADLSSDGKTLLSTESGAGGGEAGAVYRREMDGAPAVRLGDGRALALSPDRKWALALLPTNQVVLLPTGPGAARPLPRGEIVVRSGAFFPDGGRVLLTGNEPGHRNRLWVQDISGGKPRALTPEGVSFPIATNPISPDGKLLAVLGPDRTCSLYTLEEGTISSPRAIPGASPREPALRWSRDGRSLFVRGAGSPARVYRLDPWSGKRELWKEFQPAEPLGGGSVDSIVPTPDGQSWAYTYSRYFSDLFLLEGLK